MLLGYNVRNGSSSAQCSPGQSILKCFEPLTCGIEGFPPQKNSTKNMFDVVLSSAGATIALATSFD